MLGSFMEPDEQCVDYDTHLEQCAWAGELQEYGIYVEDAAAFTVYEFFLILRAIELFANALGGGNIKERMYSQFRQAMKGDMDGTVGL
jgi:hypothetical protein